MLEFKQIGNEVVVFSQKQEIYRTEYSRSVSLAHLEEVHEAVAQTICTYRLDDLPLGFYMYWTPKKEALSASHSIIDLNLNVDSSDRVDFTVSYMYQLPHWDRPYNYYKYTGYLTERMEEAGFLIEDNSIESDDGYLSVKARLCGEKSIKDLYNDVLNTISELETSLHTELISEDLEGHILKVFKFPKQYQSICSQYLIWFGEFLENFGINALISINNKNDETRIMVSSEHTEQMFREIETLFSQYIALPYAELLPATPPLEPQQQFMVTQLQSQITMFKTQLEMKSSTIQLKEVTIQGLQREIQSQQNIIDVQKNQLLLIESMQGDDELELFDGAIKLGDIEWGPIRFSPKRLLDKATDKV